jgi:hypothetical protein
MLSLKDIKDNIESVKRAISAKNIEFDLDKFAEYLISNQDNINNNIVTEAFLKVTDFEMFKLSIIAYKNEMNKKFDNKYG